jgi:hypothetical protein
VAAADDDCVVMLRHAAELRKNAKMKNDACDWKRRQFNGMR